MRSQHGPIHAGAGSVIANNLVQEGISHVALALGRDDMSVHDNFIQRPASRDLRSTGERQRSAGRPSSDVTITNNVVDSAINYGGPSIGPIVAAASITP